MASKMCTVMFLILALACTTCMGYFRYNLMCSRFPEKCKALKNKASSKDAYYEDIKRDTNDEIFKRKFDKNSRMANDFNKMIKLQRDASSGFDASDLLSTNPFKDALKQDLLYGKRDMNFPYAADAFASNGLFTGSIKDSGRLPPSKMGFYHDKKESVKSNLPPSKMGFYHDNSFRKRKEIRSSNEFPYAFDFNSNSNFPHVADFNSQKDVSDFKKQSNFPHVADFPYAFDVRSDVDFPHVSDINANANFPHVADFNTDSDFPHVADYISSANANSNFPHAADLKSLSAATLNDEANLNFPYAADSNGLSAAALNQDANSKFPYAADSNGLTEVTLKKDVNSNFPYAADSEKLSAVTLNKDANLNFPYAADSKGLFAPNDEAKSNFPYAADSEMFSAVTLNKDANSNFPYAADSKGLSAPNDEAKSNFPYAADSERVSAAKPNDNANSNFPYAADSNGLSAATLNDLPKSKMPPYASKKNEKDSIAMQLEEDTAKRSKIILDSKTFDTKREAEKEMDSKSMKEMKKLKEDNVAEKIKKKRESLNKAIKEADESIAKIDTELRSIMETSTNDENTKLKDGADNPMLNDAAAEMELLKSSNDAGFDAAETDMHDFRPHLAWGKRRM